MHCICGIQKSRKGFSAQGKRTHRLYDASRLKQMELNGLREYRAAAWRRKSAILTKNTAGKMWKTRRS